MPDSIDAQLDFIYLNFDDLFKKGKFDTADGLLKLIDVPNTDSNLLIGYLTVSNWAKSKLPYRSEFYTKVEEEFKKRARTDPDYRDPTLLQGLKR